MAKHILVADDEVHIRRLEAIHLERAGYRVSMARDGVEALERIRADRPDLLLLDGMMPRLDGFALVQRLRADPATAGLPIVMLTVMAQDEDVIEGRHRGVLDYLTKPFHPHELLHVVARILASEGG